jgi:predicted short-subunit dehydrogenase-like oxidoreductase (DUF2520 family)
MSNLAPWFIIGAGRVGRMLGIAANQSGISVKATWNRSPKTTRETKALVDANTYLTGKLESELQKLDSLQGTYWITVTDSAIEKIAQTLAGRIPSDSSVFHTSGCHSANILSEAGLPNPVASVHPLQAISSPEDAVPKLADVIWTTEGDKKAVERANRLLQYLGAESNEIRSEFKPLYHASAVTASNFTVALFYSAMKMATKAGLSRKKAKEGLISLLESTVQNLKQNRPKDALTGPVARDDLDTIETHLKSLHEKLSTTETELYEICTQIAENITDEGLD